MRNLKRVLSLTLASVMLMGMMVVGSSAAKGYDDVSDTDNVEAIEVLQEIEVMVGDDRGFGPERPVNRAEMAVVMGKLLSLDYNYYTALCPFTDVYDWAQGWVGACYANKIVSGRGDGIYDPGATVTAVEAASMLMRALGYFQYQNDYADGFELSTVTQGKKIGIFDNVGSSASEPMTRNQVAQMVLNALQSAVVEPDGNTINLTTPDGTVLTGKVNYVSVTSKKPYASAISRTEATSIGSTNDGWIVELGERLYDGKLKLNDRDQDAFGRPARTWEFDGKEIGSYVKKELLKQSYTTKVTGRMLYDLLTENTIKNYVPHFAVDGENTESVLNKSGSYSYYFDENNLIRSNTEKVGGTGDGVITEVYVDTLNEQYYVAVINTYLAKASGDYNSKTEEARFTVWALENRNSASDPVLVKNPGNTANPNKTPLDVSSEDFDVEDVKDGDIYLVQVAKGEIQVMIDPEVIDNTKITSFKKGDWVVADGSQYTYNNALRYDAEVLDAYDDFNMKDTTYRLYLDPNSFVLGVEIVEDPDQYVFLTGLGREGSNIANKTAVGNVIFLDGTTATVNINMEKSKAADGTRLGTDSLMNTWCFYSVDNDGVYTLTEVANTKETFTSKNDGDKYSSANSYDKLGQGRTAGGDGVTGLKIDKKNIDLDGILDTSFKTVYGNEETVYLTAETTQLNNAVTSNNKVQSKAIIINDVDNVVVGVQNASIFAWNEATALRHCDDWDKSAIADEFVSSGVYTLFKDNGYIIAAVVVGEDDGVSSHYAFVHSSSVNREDWMSSSSTRSNEEGVYAWYREVILDGKVETLVEKTDSSPYIKDMVQGQWYEVKFNADGTVRRTIRVFDDKGAWESDARYIKDLSDVETAVKNKDTVVLYSDLIDTKTISYKGAVLQIETGVASTSYGFPVAGDANVVLLTAKSIDGVVTDLYGYTGSYTGSIGLEQAINQLNKNNSFKGTISAVFDGGIARTVVIHDMTATDINTGANQGQEGAATVNGITVKVDAKAKAKDIYATITAGGGAISVRFETDMGAEAGSNYTYDYVLKAENGTVLDSKTGQTATTVAGETKFRATISDSMIVGGSKYTLEIKNVVPAKYKLTKAETVDGLEVADITLNSGATGIASGGTDNLTLKIPSAKISAPTDVVVSFTVSGIDFTAGTLGGGVTGENGSYTVETTVASLNGGITVLNNVKPTKEVTVTVTGISDKSSTVRVNVKLAPGSEKYATLGGTAVTSAAVDATTISLSGMTLTKAPAGIVAGANYVIQTPGKDDTTADAVPNGVLPSNVNITKTQVGVPVEITIVVTPTELTVDDALVNLVPSAVGTAADLKFDGEGNFKEGNIATSMAAANTRYNVKIGDNEPMVLTSDASNNLKADDGAFSLPVADILAGKRVIVEIDAVYSITGGGLTETQYVTAGDTFTLPAKGNNRGTGFKVETAGGTTEWKAYGDTITPAGNITLTAGYVSITKEGAAKDDCTVSPTGESDGNMFVKVGQKITLKNTDTTNKKKFSAVDSEGNQLLGETEVDASGSQETTQAAGENNIIVTAAAVGP